jgi:hypothetical protein
MPMRLPVEPMTAYAKKRNYSLGLINSQNELWKRQRSLSNPIVAKPRSVFNYLNIHNSIINEFTHLIKAKLSKSENEELKIDSFDEDLRFLALESIILNIYYNFHKI